MVKKIIMCDFCKKEIKGENIRLIANRVDTETGDIVSDFLREQWERDYHPDCVNKILDYANNHEVVTEPEEVSTEPELVVPTSMMGDFLEKAQEEVKEETESDESEGTQDPQEPEEKKKKRNKLDIGKILALRDAGWTHQQIAEEMGTTKETIAVTICKNKKKS